VRYHLLTSFNLIRILDLHGNSKIHEVPPDGGVDQNVFDIQQGVAVSLFARTPRTIGSRISYAELWGSRANKYDQLLALKYTFSEIDVEALPPNYLFLPQDNELAGEYENYPSLTDIFQVFGSGITTARDKVVVDFEDSPIVRRVQLFVDSTLSEDAVLSELEIGESAIWTVAEARSRLRNLVPHRHIVDVAYRPFDKRRLFYHNSLVSSPRRPTMRHMSDANNVALAVCRQQGVPGFRHVFVSRMLFDEGLVSNRSREKTVAFPLHCAPEDTKNYIHGGSMIPNIKSGFLSKLEEHLGMRWQESGNGSLETGGTVGPEDILDYIYALLHSQSYRLRYEALLKNDFPRIPVTHNISMFANLCNFGENLVKLHLMESCELNNHMTTFPASGDNTVTKVAEKGKTLAEVANGKGKLFINKTQYFDSVPEQAWNFHIGSYQVCHKWLADRKKAGRKLTAEDIEHYHKIVVSINETIKIMNQIDEVIESHGGWPVK